MDVGTAELLDEDIAPERRPDVMISSSGSGNPGDGGDDNSGGSGGEHNRSHGDVPLSPAVPDKSRILTAFLLVVVLMTFGGLIAAYIVIATNNVAEWHPFELPVQVWLSTAIILVSSWTYHLGKAAIDRNDQPSAKRWLIITTVLGAAFISSQILAWFALNARGLYMQGNPYAGFFYILTAVHAVHVIGGITALGAILLRNLSPTENPLFISRRRTLAQTVGWYWHFMGALWVILFVLLGFWK